MELAILAWWRGKCPFVYSEKEHLLFPLLNCVTADERRLANIASKIIKSRKKP